MKTRFSIGLAGLATVFAMALASGTTGAITGSGAASLSMSPAGGSYAQGSTFTVTISETSSVAIASVQADVTFDTAKLQCLGVSGGSFAQSYQASCGNGVATLAYGVQGTPLNGAQTVGSVTFKVVGSGSVSLGFGAASDVNDSNVASVCDATCSGSHIAATFTLTDTAPNPGMGSGSGDANNNAANDTATNSGTGATPAGNSNGMNREVQAVAATAATQNESSQPAATGANEQAGAKQPELAKQVPVAPVADKASNVWGYAIGVLVVVAGLGYLFRRQVTRLVKRLSAQPVVVPSTKPSPARPAKKPASGAAKKPAKKTGK